MLGEVYAAMRSAYPAAFQSSIEQAIGLVARGDCRKGSDGYHVVASTRGQPDEQCALEDFVVTTNTYGHLACPCDAKARQGGGDDEEIEEEGACLHVIAASVYEYDATYEPRRPASPEPHSITIGGMTPSGYSVLACMRGMDYTALTKETRIVNDLWAKQGMLPCRDYRPGMSSVTPAVTAVIEPVLPFDEPVSAPRNPVRPAGESAHALRDTARTEEAPAPQRKDGGWYKGGNKNPTYGASSKKAAQKPDGSFPADRLVGFTSSKGKFFWRVASHRMPQGYQWRQMTIFDEGLTASGIDPEELDREEGMDLRGYVAWYVNGPDGAPNKVVCLEKDAG